MDFIKRNFVLPQPCCDAISSCLFLSAAREDDDFSELSQFPNELKRTGDRITERVFTRPAIVACEHTVEIDADARFLRAFGLETLAGCLGSLFDDDHFVRATRRWRRSGTCAQDGLDGADAFQPRLV